MEENTKTTKKNLVIDTSAILPILFSDEQIPPNIQKTITRFKQNEINLLAPSLIKYEVGNALRSAVLRKRLGLKTSKQLYQEFLGLSIQIIPINYSQILQIGVENKISFYNASYLHLAQSTKTKLITLDKKLASLV